MSRNARRDMGMRLGTCCGRPARAKALSSASHRVKKFTVMKSADATCASRSLHTALAFRAHAGSVREPVHAPDKSATAVWLRSPDGDDRDFREHESGGRRDDRLLS